MNNDMLHKAGAPKSTEMSSTQQKERQQSGSLAGSDEVSNNGEEPQTKQAKTSCPFVSAGVTNLARYRPTGGYYARVRVNGKLLLKSLHTTKKTVAVNRLGDFAKSARKGARGLRKQLAGKYTFEDSLEDFKKNSQDDPDKKPNSKVFDEDTYKRIKSTAKELLPLRIDRITKAHCESWARKCMLRYCPETYNRTLADFKGLFVASIKNGIIYENPAADLEVRKVPKKGLILPTPLQFNCLIDEMRSRSWKAADLCEFLAYGGFRIDEARNITWSDIDFEKKQITVRGDPVWGTKNSQTRPVPILPEMDELLNRIKCGPKSGKRKDYVIQVKGCRTVMYNSCAKLKLPRYHHHNMRDFFATRCLEEGVDVPTVALWLGHQDRGILVLKRYTHVSSTHSSTSAAKVHIAHVIKTTPVEGHSFIPGPGPNESWEI
jgi:integrase